MTDQTTLDPDRYREDPARATAGSAPERCRWRDRPPGSRGSPAWNAVARALDSDPEASAEELYGIALREDPRIRELAVRQFEARVPLQIRKERLA